MQYDTLLTVYTDNTVKGVCMSDKPLCPKCGAEMEGNRLWCPSCGSPSELAKKRKNQTISNTLLLCAVICFFAAMFSGSQALYILTDISFVGFAVFLIISLYG